MRCPQCGALNADSADWCTQCYTSLNEPAAGTEASAEDGEDGPTDAGLVTAPSPTDAGAVATPDSVGTGAGDATGATIDVSGADFRRVGDDVEWRCAVCEQWNLLEEKVCTVCGVAFEETVGVTEEDAELRAVDSTTALVASAVLPGLGHVLLGRVGSGVVRSATFVLWLIGGLILLRGASGAGQSVLPALPLLLGAGVLWLLGMNDTAVLAGAMSGRELLTPRVFLWLVVGVVGALIMSFVPALMQVTSETASVPPP